MAFLDQIACLEKITPVDIFFYPRLKILKVFGLIVGLAAAAVKLLVKKIDQLLLIYQKH